MSHFKPSITCGHIKKPKLWLIDMDDTLYSASAGMFKQIDTAMTRYIQENLGLDPEQANELRLRYWIKYGVTYYGLWKYHNIDPHEFLTATHQCVDTSKVITAGDTARALAKLPGTKVLFTNAPRCFADKILTQLNLSCSFNAKYCAEDMRVFGHWRPKPSIQMFRKISSQFNIRPSDICLIDDGINNLKVAKRLGLQTVLCKGWHHHGLSVSKNIHYIDSQIGHIREIPKVLLKEKQQETKLRKPVLLNPYS